MTDCGRSTGWTWRGAAGTAVLFLALTGGAGIGSAVAQDATPDPEARSSPPATGEEAGRPAHIHSGTCEGGGVGPIVQALNNVAAPEGDAEGQERGVTAESSFTSVPLALEDILAVDHVINVHLSGEEFETYIACGEIGGVIAEDGTLAVGVREANESGFTGIAFLAPDATNPDATNVSLFIAEGLGEGNEVSLAGTPLAVQATEAAEATEEAEGDDEAEEDEEGTPTS